MRRSFEFVVVTSISWSSWYSSYWWIWDAMDQEIQRQACDMICQCLLEFVLTETYSNLCDSLHKTSQTIEVGSCTLFIFVRLIFFPSLFFKKMSTFERDIPLERDVTLKSTFFSGKLKIVHRQWIRWSIGLLFEYKRQIIKILLHGTLKIWTKFTTQIND
jgi:hypothetical protein